MAAARTKKRAKRASKKVKGSRYECGECGLIVGMRINRFGRQYL
jgi:hypothetical protein